MQSAKIVPLHSSLGNRARLSLKKKKKSLKTDQKVKRESTNVGITIYTIPNRVP